MFSTKTDTNEKLNGTHTHAHARTRTHSIHEIHTVFLNYAPLL
jgi:hypothetical protein